MNTTPLIASAPAATSASSHGQESIVARLQSSQIYRDYQQAFQVATGLPLVLRAAGSFQPPLQGSKQINPFCALLASTSKTCAACLQMQQRVEDEAIDGSKTLQCYAGFSESVVPVYMGERVMAYLQTGQILLQNPTEKSYRAAMAKLDKISPGIGGPEYHAAYFRTRVLSKSHYDAVVRLLTSFAQHLSLVCNELMIKQSAAEPPVVARARAYIAEHLGEPLSLRQVAQAANISAFYFCKVFKSATGVTFTDYISRARVEKTKQLLLNPHCRVSEAAYEAGFQSLSQFNRVFRRIEGQSPSHYREQLHGSEPSRPRSSYAYAA